MKTTLAMQIRLFNPDVKFVTVFRVQPYFSDKFWQTIFLRRIGNFPLQSLCPSGRSKHYSTFSVVAYPVHFFVRLNARGHAMKVGYTFNCLDVPARLIFHVIKIVRSARAGKATAMANGLIDLCGTVSFIIRILRYSGDKISKILSARWRGGGVLNHPMRVGTHELLQGTFQAPG
jgi:hypothetical protein